MLKQIDTNIQCISLGRDASGMSAGQRFMTDLLVSSLMADGGLEFAMEEAIKKEKEAFEDKKVGVLVHESFDKILV